MKLNLSILLLAAFALTGCAGSDTVNSPFAHDSAIVGGSTTAKDNLIKNYVVLIYDNPTKTYCTGTLIQKNLILTAAHCVGAGPTGLSLAFGLNPLSGAYTLRKAHKTAIHDRYKKMSTSDRNDVALISFKDPAPENYRPIAMPGADFPLTRGLTFTAAGYGRTSGKKGAPGDPQGSGLLRNVDLVISLISTDENQFYVDQKNGRGICNGDSGGPALMRYNGIDYVVGIASAVSWTVPDEVKDEHRAQYIEKKDFCREKSVYMNVKKFRPWIDENSKKLLQ